MRVPYDWLAEKFATPPDRSRIATALFESGFELEAMHWVRPGLETVVTGRILTCQAHPNADRLRICPTDIGAADPLQIVTAAPNVQAGDIVPVALVGSKLPTGKEIALGKLRGVESHGMFCSTEELGIASDTPAEGVLVLPPDTPVGQNISSVLQLGECVLEIAITANRGDGLSVSGLALALGAAGLGELAMPLAPPVATAVGPSGVQVHLEAEELCPRYTAQIVSGVRVGPSPDWLAHRLELAGIRSLNNVIDVTNYVMLDAGQPLHAFDLAKVEPASLTVRVARPQESLRTLDGVSRTLPEGALVIADARGPLAIAGVMGGEASAVSDRTTDVLLESAYFKPGSVRQTARRLGLSSESSYRFERGVDPEATAKALAQAANLLVEVAGGKPAGAPADARKPGFPGPIVVPLRAERADQVLGCTIAADRQAQLLERLGFVEITGEADHAGAIGSFLDRAAKAEFGHPEIYGDARWFRVPGWRRHDVLREIDLIEEIAQQHGYAAIAETLPALDRLVEAQVPVADRLRDRLRGFGFWEVLTTSVVSRPSQEGFVPGDADLVALADPMGDLQVMRASLIPSLLEVARTNVSRGADRVLVFDTGRVYRQTQDQRHESLSVAALAVGAVGEGLWKRPPAAFEADFFWAKGVAQGALEALGLWGLEAIAAPGESGLHPGRAARFELEGQQLAVFGELHPGLAEHFALGDRSRAAVVRFDPAAIEAALERRGSRPFVPFSRFPASERDVALVLDGGRQAGAIVESARQTGGDLLERVRIFDRYVGPQIPQGKISLALSLRYRASDRTLTDSEVDALHGRIVEALCERFEATVRV